MERLKQARLTVFGEKNVVDVYVPPVDEGDRSLASAIKSVTEDKIIPRILDTWFEGSDIVIVDGKKLQELTKPPLKLGELRHIRFSDHGRSIPIKYSALIRYNHSPGSMTVKTRPYKVFR